MLRKLSAEEKQIIREAKKKGNDAIKAQRKHLQNEMKKLEYRLARSGVKRQLESLTLVKGYPVAVTTKGDVVVCVDWGLARKLKLDRGYTVKCEVEPGKLIICYEKEGLSGRVELFELPKHQVEQLQNRVPVIFI